MLHFLLHIFCVVAGFGGVGGVFGVLLLAGGRVGLCWLRWLHDDRRGRRFGVGVGGRQALADLSHQQVAAVVPKRFVLVIAGAHFVNRVRLRVGGNLGKLQRPVSDTDVVKLAHQVRAVQGQQVVGNLLGNAHQVRPYAVLDEGALAADAVGFGRVDRQHRGQAGGVDGEYFFLGEGAAFQELHVALAHGGGNPLHAIAYAAHHHQ